ncbi:MAG: hypothetical protein KDA83_16630, partial [Planctomycetales bacterium]|nr:hypothetical protein [Planctomycetales bacterium]
ARKSTSTPRPQPYIHPIVKPRTASRGIGIGWIVGGITAVSILFLVVLLGVVLMLRTPNGTVRVEIAGAPDDVRLSLDGDRIVMDVDGGTYTVDVGIHELKIEADGFRTETRTFEITKGDETLLTLGLIPEEPTVPQGAILIVLSDPNAIVEVQIDGHVIPKREIAQPIPLDAKEHQLVVSGNGFETISQPFRVVAGNNPPLNISLVPVAQGPGIASAGVQPTPTGGDGQDSSELAIPEPENPLSSNSITQPSPVIEPEGDTPIIKVGVGPGLVSLPEALSSALPGAVIEIHTNEPIDLGGARINLRMAGDLTIRAGEGYSPILTRKPDSSSEAMIFAGARGQAGHLKLAQLTIVDIQSPAGASMIFACPVDIVDCTFVSNGGQVINIDLRSNDAQMETPSSIERCYFHGCPTGTNQSVVFVSLGAAIVAIRDSLFVGTGDTSVLRSGHEAVEGYVRDITLERCTCINIESVMCIDDPSRVASHNNLFLGTGRPLRLLFNGAITRADPIAGLDYEGQSNLYFQSRNLPSDDANGWLWVGFDRWVDFTGGGEKNALFFDPQFAHRNLRIGNQSTVLPPAAYALSRSSAAVRRGIGADVMAIPSLSPNLPELLPATLRPSSEVLERFAPADPAGRGE